MVYDQKIAKQTAKYLLQINAIKLNTENYFQWASGWISPIYCDNRLALSFPEIRSYLAKSIADTFGFGEFPHPSKIIKITFFSITRFNIQTKINKILRLTRFNFCITLLNK